MKKLNVAIIGQGRSGRGIHGTFFRSGMNEKYLDDFVNMFRSGRMPHGYDSLVKPLKLMHCIEESYLQNKEVPVVW